MSGESIDKELDVGKTTNFIRSRGMLFPNDPDFIVQKTRRALRSNRYETREADAVRALVNQNDVALELGAGIGYMSTLMARNCAAKEVHAYEANPRLIPYIRAVHEANEVTDKVHLKNAILGEEEGRVTFYERDAFAASSLEENPRRLEAKVIATHEIDVLNVKTEMRRIKPTALVCDIEGAEADLIPLMDLSTLRVAVVELHPQWIGKAGVQAVFDAFHAAGLTFFPKWANKKVVTFKRDW